MELILDGVLVLLGLAGMFCLACGLFCRLLLPDSPYGTWAVVWGCRAAACCGAPWWWRTAGWTRPAGPWR